MEMITWELVAVPVESLSPLSADLWRERRILSGELFREN